MRWDQLRPRSGRCFFNSLLEHSRGKEFQHLAARNPRGPDRRRGCGFCAQGCCGFDVGGRFAPAPCEGSRIVVVSIMCRLVGETRTDLRLRPGVATSDPAASAGRGQCHLPGTSHMSFHRPSRRWSIAISGAGVADGSRKPRPAHRIGHVAAKASIAPGGCRHSRGSAESCRSDRGASNLSPRARVGCCAMLLPEPLAGAWQEIGAGGGT